MLFLKKGETEITIREIHFLFNYKGNHLFPYIQHFV
jgi:hypothetical protein